MHVTDREAFHPVEAAVAVMSEFHRQGPFVFGWRMPPYEYEHEKMPIDILAGSGALRSQIEAGLDGPFIATTWTNAVEAFMPVRGRYLIY